MIASVPCKCTLTYKYIHIFFMSALQSSVMAKDMGIIIQSNISQQVTQLHYIKDALSQITFQDDQQIQYFCICHKWSMQNRNVLSVNVFTKQH